MLLSDFAGECLIMPLSKVNVFYFISALFSLALVGYLWLFYLPMYENAAEYTSIKMIVMMVTGAMVLVIAANVYLATREKETSHNLNTSEPSGSDNKT
jgi:hypothetical protein